MQNFWVTNKEHYGICYGIFWNDQKYNAYTLGQKTCDEQ